MRGSDLDLMFVGQFFEVFEDVKLRFNPNKTYFSMKKDNTKLGYTYLRIEQCRHLGVFLPIRRIQ